MSKNLGSLLQKLDKVIGVRPTGQRVDWKERDALKKKSFTKLQPGKNNIVAVPHNPEDPFVIWGYHNSLQKESYWSVPCDAHNKNEQCIVCDVIADLKAENEEGNRHIWFPIELKFEFYIPIVNVDSEDTIEEGPKWLRFGKSILSQFKEWLDNTDDDEEPFYSDEEPQKVIVTYNKSAAPSEMYKLDKKRMKPFDKSTLKEWRGKLEPVETFLYSKTEDQLKKIVDEYFERVAAEVEKTTKSDKAAQEDKVIPKKVSPVDIEDDEDEDVDVVDALPTKLNRLKR